MTDERPAFSIKWQGVEITAARMVNMQLVPIWNFGGHFRQNNRMGIIDFEMPLELESHEQAIAWMADSLLFRSRLQNAPDWLQEGLQWRDKLPWIRRQKAYAARERCRVVRDWFRLPCKAMRRWAEEQPGSIAQFFFDGEVLRITGNGELLVIPAEGAAWTQPVQIAVDGLRHLPKRLMRDVDGISIWEGKLYIGRLTLPLVVQQIDR